MQINYMQILEIKKYLDNIENTENRLKRNINNLIEILSLILLNDLVTNNGDWYMIPISKNNSEENNYLIELIKKTLKYEEYLEEDNSITLLFLPQLNQF